MKHKKSFKASTFCITGVIWLLSLFGLLPAAWALEKPVDPVVLTLSGQISQMNDGKTAVFSMQMLSKLPQHTVTTKSPWYPAGAQFTGPLLRTVLEAAGAKGNKIIASALNDYKTEIPFDDANAHDVILAYLMNGKPMPIRDKGPLFIVYPFDAKPELKSQVFYNRSAWQLNRLKVE